MNDSQSCRGPRVILWVQVRPYQEDEVVLVVGSRHRFASRTHIDKEELLGLSFVSLHRSSTVQGIKNTLVGHGVDWKALKVVMVSPPALTLCPVQKVMSRISRLGLT